VIRSQVNDGPVTTYKAGQSFSELPGDRHAVSANASETKPANLRGVRGGHERDGADNPIRELTGIVIASVVAAAPLRARAERSPLGLLDIIARRISRSAAIERPFRRISTNDVEGVVASVQYRPNICSSWRHASLKSRSGSTCRSIQLSRISSIVIFGARYASIMMRHTLSAASTTCGDEIRHIRFVSA